MELFAARPISHSTQTQAVPVYLAGFGVLLTECHDEKEKIRGSGRATLGIILAGGGISLSSFVTEA